jgi:hypothetical protein
MMPEEPTPKHPNENDRGRHLNRCGPKLRPILSELDRVIQSNLADVEVDWEPQEFVGYWIANHLWVTIRTNQTLLWLCWRLQKTFQLSTDLAGQLGVRDEDVWIGKPDNPKGMKGVHVRIKVFPDPDALRRFLEELPRFLTQAHDSALIVWS